MAKLNVKPPDRVAAKWARRVAGATTDYTDGAQGAGQRWQTGAVAGKENYKQGTAEAAASGRFERGVASAGPSEYESGIRDKGAMRYGPGAAAAEGKFQRKIGPVLSAIAALDVPPRGPRRSEGNYQRATTVARGLAQMATRK